MFSTVLSALNHPQPSVHPPGDTTPDSLLLLSTVALNLLQKKKKRVRKPNPMCSLPGHSKWRTNASIQRHTCWECFKARAQALFANPNLTRWDVACVLAREFRNYFCCCCILDADPADLERTVHHTKSCRRGHRAICKERKCVAHQLRLTICTKCPDPRAGTSFHLCGHRVYVRCNCANRAIDGSAPQEPQVVATKATYAASLLQRAQESNN